MGKHLQGLGETLRVAFVVHYGSILGVAEGAYARAVRWTEQRVQGGCPLIQHDIIAQELAELHMLTDPARAYIYHAAWAADHREVGL